MTEKTVLITGATSGIGYAGAEALARKGWRVLAHGRSEARLQPVLERLRASVRSGSFEGVTADLGSLESVAGLADQVKAKAGVLDALWNNAGGLITSRKTSADGYELQMAVNHLAPFALTKLLLPLIKASPQGRVVATSSMAHAFAPDGIEDWLSSKDGSYRAFSTYGQSKLANLLFTQELAVRLRGSAATANAFHPGWVRTNFGSGANPGEKSPITFASIFAISPDKGADTGVFLVDEPGLSGQSGLYWVKRKAKAPSRKATREAAALLWDQSEAAVAKAGIR